MMLRAGKIPARDAWQNHTYLTEQLFAGVLESELLLEARMSRLVAWAALHGHPSADLEQAGQSLRVHYIDALSCVPYITGGQSGANAMQQERTDFAKRYQAYKQRVLQGRQLRAPRDKLAGIKVVGQKHGKQ